ncbi:MAG: hypothetical protein H6642_15640 [Caldilineaceae bacterium]|nr:hypothetical protein [Caldilineaceae bacterium]
MALYMRKILRVVLFLTLLLATQLPLYAAPTADEPQTIDDNVVVDYADPPANKYSTVNIDVLALDLPVEAWLASTVRIVNLTNPSLDTYLTKYVEPDQGIWEVNTETGVISFTPCTGSGTPDLTCTTALNTDMPFPIDYVVEDTNHVLSNPAQVTVTYKEPDPSLNELLAYFSSSRVDGITNFVWVMWAESGNAGFNILVDKDGTLEPINDQLIASRVIDSPEPQRYDYAAQIDEDVFYLQEVSIYDEVTTSGPFALGETIGENPFEETNQDTQIFLPLISKE